MLPFLMLSLSPWVKPSKQVLPGIRLYVVRRDSHMFKIRASGDLLANFSKSIFIAPYVL
jgi:hypothetical protein